METYQRNSKFSKIFRYYLFLLFCFGSCIYFLFFVYNKGFTYEPIDGWLYPVNIHDHYVYLSYIEDIESSGDWITLSGLNNNFGISLLYYFFHGILNIFGINISYESLALIINLFILFCVLKAYAYIIYKFNLDSTFALTFFLMTPLVYFAQLINKDSFTILIILLAIKFSLEQRWKSFLILTIVSALIRFQLPALLLLYLFFIIGEKKHILKFIAAYVFLSLVNGILAKYQTEFFSESTLSDGMSYMVYSLNRNYYIGSLLLNPIRAIQYIHDAIISFAFIDGCKIDVGRFKNIPQVAFLLFLTPFILNSIINYSFYMNQKEKYLLAMICAFFGIWLFNPTINLRYFILFFPVLQILGLSMYINFKKQNKALN
ncbi:hypothetical protein CDU00_07940 [Cronobacter sakazakii]|uniref:hypothetical protein n=1 Tax=Cronobacter sakazakii TaxID=28141 RepID=UPI000BE8435D|nr:hypothetical protein [Cronobacter sakazakii]EKD3161503.1 hypothetical protein [Cronobacter sakazakii]EKD3182166.1 hypothetical protein [Cronobacter sakazakii]EKD3191958.1 hypothetical protein [Cronobacter sakazakii]EKD3201066.1 hypothetical protein [Cronobacter sakazakii]EKD3244422.1 hypothetical protein [Cronobacter sakazakii]